MYRSTIPFIISPKFSLGRCKSVHFERCTPGCCMSDGLSNQETGRSISKSVHFNFQTVVVWYSCKKHLILTCCSPYPKEGGGAGRPNKYSRLSFHWMRITLKHCSHGVLASEHQWQLVLAMWACSIFWVCCRCKSGFQEYGQVFQISC